ncbi:MULTISPECIES: hydrogenase maturation protease [unclassified Methanoculleus]|uniref:Hydrogenase maturation protease n=2 Tax=Methanoculleus TaxID=45989 RepID=A0ABD8A7E7_9EURY|nr:hydrogenase maturation protease [Methanoculleus palmolei]
MFVGVGNRMWGDDGIGSVLLDSIKDHVRHAIDAGITPEEYTGIIKRFDPSVIVFLDAVDWGADPGRITIVEREEVSWVRMGIHKISLEILMEYLQEETGADVFIIGIQPAVVAQSSGLSPESSQAVRHCAGVILSLLDRENL